MLSVDEIRIILQASVALSKSDGDTIKKSTVAETYHVGKLSGNRLNSGTIRSQLIVCQDENTWLNSDDGAKKSIHSDQRVFVQVGDDLWDVYRGKDLSENGVPELWKHNIKGLAQFLSNKPNLEFSTTPAASIVSDLFDGMLIKSDVEHILGHHDILSAIRTKPFVLLAGISGTGKSRLVRQLARGVCPAEHDLAKDTQGNQTNKPGNYELIPVKPNWHDSTELMGYVSRVSGKPEYVIKPFVRFLAKAWLYEAEGVPFFLCLDEMNLAPVEQYFAEYLSVIETRKMVEGGKIETDPLIIFENDEMLEAVLDEIYEDAKHGDTKSLIDMFKAKGGIPIPSNFVVMGTVNMDETTFSFSRKVLDRAMSFELNEVDMDKGLEADDSIPYGSLPLDCAKATYVEGRDVYAAEKSTCDKVKTYLVSLNAELEGTPFKFAYRSRNEIMIYVVERIRNGVASLPEAVDEATSMKILSRVEGDTERITEAKLKSLQDVIVKSLLAVGGKDATDADVKVFLASDQAKKSPCFLKLEQMIKAVRDGVGFVSFWQN